MPKYKPPKTIDEYIKRQSPKARGILKKIRQTIKKAIPKAEEAISYQIPVIKKDRAYVVYFAAWEKHVSLYPIPRHIPPKFKKEIAPYIAGKGTLKFSLLKKIPYTLIKKVAKFRMKESAK